MPQKEARSTDSWPVYSVQARPIDGLIPYARNARTHSAEQVASLARLIEEFGWTMPILVDEGGEVIAGHGRILAAQRLGLAAVPVATAAGWTDEQKRAYRIADNRLAELSTWDDDLLKIEIGELKDLGADTGVLGFDESEIARLLFEAVADGDPEAVPEPEAAVVSAPGDIWLLGGHRLICGDSTDRETVEALLAGAKPHLMVTDPPYGVEYDANWRNERVRSDGTPIAGSAIGKVLNDERADWRSAWDLFIGDVAYVWHADLRARDAVESLEASGFVIRAQIIWAKQQFAIGRGDYHFQHEPCWYAVRKGKTGHWGGGRKQTTLWEIPKPQKSETGHSTQKPVECMKRPIENNSKPGDAVYEPFSGSGTTIIAAEMTGRRCYAVELNPAYVDIAVRRWQTFTGKAATLESTGEPFDDVAAYRAAEAA